MSSISVAGDTSGSVTLSAPAVANTTVLTLPSVSGTVLTSASSQVTGPAFSAYQNVAQTITTATYTKIQFQAKEFDTNSNFDSTTNYRFTPTVAGYYQFSGGANQGGATTAFQLVLYKNGVAIKFFSNSTASAPGVSGSALVNANGSTDYFELYIYLVIGGTLSATPSLTYFQAFLARSA